MESVLTIPSTNAINAELNYTPSASVPFTVIEIERE